MNRSFLITTATTLNFLIPGSGFSLLHALKRALMWQLSLWLVVALFCWNRWVLTPTGACWFLLTIISLHLSATLDTCFYHWRKCKNMYNEKNKINNEKGNFEIVEQQGQCLKQSLFCGTFIMIALVISLTGFITKNYWLGIQINFISSASMAPTLMPRQLILVDTWAYRDNEPKLNDVVVFSHGVKNKTLIKRITTWPDENLWRDGLLYVTGDNKNASQDSRYFGGIASTTLQGKATLSILALDENHQIKTNPWLIPIH